MKGRPTKPLASYVMPRLEERLHKLGTIPEGVPRLVAGVELMTQIFELGEDIEGAYWQIRGQLGLEAKPE